MAGTASMSGADQMIVSMIFAAIYYFLKLSCLYLLYARTNR